jgi:hypothetical protein
VNGRDMSLGEIGPRSAVRLARSLWKAIRALSRKSQLWDMYDPARAHEPEPVNGGGSGIAVLNGSVAFPGGPT